MVSCFVLIFCFLFVCWGAGALLVSYPESFWSWKLATGAINSLVKCVLRSWRKGFMDYFPQTLVSQQTFYSNLFNIIFFYVLEYDFSLLCSYINRFSIHVDQINIFHFYKALQVTRSHQPRQHHPLASCRVSICRLAVCLSLCDPH